uniref:Uncharacterized protein n=1 Tax=Rhizophora mucronata TaxID=61149 RepID=A0A2P2R1A7_RHIMU
MAHHIALNMNCSKLSPLKGQENN